MIAQRYRIVAHQPHRVHLDVSLEEIEVRRTLAEIARVEQQYPMTLGADAVDQVSTFGIPPETGPAPLVRRNGEDLTVRVVGMENGDGLFLSGHPSVENHHGGRYYDRCGERKLKYLT